MYLQALAERCSGQVSQVEETTVKKQESSAHTPPTDFYPLHPSVEIFLKGINSLELMASDLHSTCP